MFLCAIATNRCVNGVWRRAIEMAAKDMGISSKANHQEESDEDKLKAETNQTSQYNYKYCFRMQEVCFDFELFGNSPTKFVLFRDKEHFYF